MLTNSYKNLRGYMLIELIMAVAISLLLIAFLIEIYLTSMRSTQLQEALNQLQDHGKTAVAIVSAEIHKSENHLYGSTQSMIVTQHADFPVADLYELKSDKCTLYASTHARFSAGDWVYISDGINAEIFQANIVSRYSDRQKIVANSPLKHLYSTHTEISRYKSNTFFVAKTDRKNPDGSPIYSLYVRNIKNRKSELVAGVYGMHIRYYVRTTNGLQEVQSGDIEDWKKVSGVAIRLELFAPPIRKIWYAYIALHG